MSMSKPNADASIGATQIGSIVMTYLFGISTLQVYHYMYYYPRDSLWLKSLVSLVWLVGAGHAISVIAAMYSLTVTHFGDVSSEEMIQLPTGFIWAIVLSGFVTLLVQGYFAHRIRVFSKKLYIPVFCWSMSTLRFAGTLYITVGALRTQRLSKFLRRCGWLLAAILIGGACLDIIIAASMCYYLKREKVFAFTRTAKMLDKLMVYSIETGLLTSITGVTIYICYRLMPMNYSFFAVFMFFPEVFTITMLVSLNLRRVHNDECEAVIGLPQAGPADGMSSSRSKHFSKGFSAGSNNDYLRSAKSISVGPCLDSLRGHRDIVIEITHETQEHRDQSLDANGPCIAT
ncbi:hypothetical protein BU15DRAFT_81941 [Melanogaster broomeanus]|nr:hypothetical protein BU15DRAFT_81941 [Melanogaster broomeanus]